MSAAHYGGGFRCGKEGGRRALGPVFRSDRGGFHAGEKDLGGGGKRAADPGRKTGLSQKRAFAGGDPVLFRRRPFGPADRHLFWGCEPGVSLIRDLRRLLDHGRGHGTGGDGGGGRLRGSYYGGGLQSFRLGGEAVSLSSGIWEPKALFRHLDGDGLRDGGDL